MEDKKDPGMSQTRATHRCYSTNLLAALQGEVGHSRGEKRRGKWQIEETEDMERKTS